MTKEETKHFIKIAVSQTLKEYGLEKWKDNGECREYSNLDKDDIEDFVNQVLIGMDDLVKSHAKSVEGFDI